MWPIYTGGADKAIRQGAQAQVALAQAARSGVASISQLELARAYFGQQAARQLLVTSEAQLTALQAHAHNAERMQAHGVLARSRVLEVGVARDAAQRTVERARLQLINAQDDLTRLLDVPGTVAPTTPLFVRAHPLPPVEQYLDTGTTLRAEVRAAEVCAWARTPRATWRRRRSSPTPSSTAPTTSTGATPSRWTRTGWWALACSSR